MKLYEGWRSSASWRVRWALALKKIPYQSVLIDIEQGEQFEVLPALNPMMQVPTLELDGGLALTESVAIIEWLEETHPDPPLLPKDPLERARVRALVQLINSGIHPLQNTKVRKAISDDAETQRAWCAQWIARGLKAYEAHLAGTKGPFSCGERMTMADLFLVPQVRNAERHGADISSCARVLEIYRLCLETPDARATHPEQIRSKSQ